MADTRVIGEDAFKRDGPPYILDDIRYHSAHYLNTSNKIPRMHPMSFAAIGCPQAPEHASQIPPRHCRAWEQYFADCGGGSRGCVGSPVSILATCRWKDRLSRRRATDESIDIEEPQRGGSCGDEREGAP
jgi:hypothetical protein